MPKGKVVTKTIVIWDECGQQPIRFFIVPKDVSALNRVYINDANGSEVREDRLTALVYSKGTPGQYKNPMYALFPIDQVDEHTAVIVAGILP